MKIGEFISYYNDGQIKEIMKYRESDDINGY